MIFAMKNQNGAICSMTVTVPSFLISIINSNVNTSLPLPTIATRRYL